MSVCLCVCCVCMCVLHACDIQCVRFAAADKVAKAVNKPSKPSSILLK